MKPTQPAHAGGEERMKSQDIQDLKVLIEFLKAHQVAEFELDRGEERVRLKFSQPESASPSLAELARLLAVAPAPVAQAAQATVAEAAPVATPPCAEDANMHIVKSPIVGTFYASPAPGAAPFVAPGERVEKGKVLCIIEAMKLMNEIESDASGEIVKCLVSTGQPIEFGQPLFAIRLV